MRIKFLLCLHCTEVLQAAMAVVAPIYRKMLVENNSEDTKKYECPRCESLVRNAVQTFCGHWMCHDCAVELFKEASPRCPYNDCNELWIDDGEQPFFTDRFVRKTLNTFTTKCVYVDSVHVWTGQLGELAEHLKEYALVECQDCHKFIKTAEFNTHKDVCSSAMVYCPFAESGCDIKCQLTKEELIKHLTTPVGLTFHLTLVSQILKASGSQKFNNLGSEKGGTGPTTGNVMRRDAFLGSHLNLQECVSEGAGATAGVIDVELSASCCNPNAASLWQMNLEMPSNQVMLHSLANFQSISTSLVEKDAEICALREKIGKLEKSFQDIPSDGEDQDFRLSLIENSNFDGTMIWTIPQFKQRMENACSGKYTSIFSQPFYSGRYGYKMCLRLYIYGDGIGKNSHMSLFFVVMKGESDDTLQWPFTHKVVFRLINQHNRRVKKGVLQPNPHNYSFQRPKASINIGTCVLHMSFSELMEGEFILNDSVFIEVIVDTVFQDQLMSTQCDCVTGMNWHVRKKSTTESSFEAPVQTGDSDKMPYMMECVTDTQSSKG